MQISSPTVHFDEWRLPAHWAGALINDDWTGYDGEEAEQIQHVLYHSGLSKHSCLSMDDEADFELPPSYYPASYGLLAGAYATFTFKV